MKRVFMIIALGGLLMVVDGMTTQAADTQATQTTPAASAVEVGNKICPVSGEKIPEPGAKGDMGEAVKYEYNGKIYNLCCKMCIKDFKKDPEKYSKKAEDQVKASAGEQK